MERIVLPFFSAREFGDAFVRRYHPEMVRDWERYKRKKDREEQQTIRMISKEETVQAPKLDPERAVNERRQQVQEENRQQEMMDRRLDPNRLRHMYADLLMSVPDMAKELRVPEQWVWVALKRHNIRRTDTMNQVTASPEEVRKLYIDEDLRLRDLCEMFHVSQTKMSAYLLQHGIIKTFKRGKYDYNDIKKKYEAGWSADRIAAGYGVSGVSMRNYISKYKIKRSANEQSDVDGTAYAGS